DTYHHALFGLGYVKAVLNDYFGAYNIYQKLLRNAQQKGNKKDEAIYFHQLGMVERMIGNYKCANSFFSQEATIYYDYFPEYTLGFAANWYEQGYIAMKQGKLQNAKKIMHQSLDYAIQSEDSISIGCSHRGLGEIYHLLSSRILGNKHFQMAIKAFDEADDSIGVQEVVNMMRKWEDPT